MSEADRLVLASIRAKDCAEALLRVLMLKAPPAEVAATVSAVLCQRLVRKLCDHCKEAYAPAPSAPAIGDTLGAGAGILSPPSAQARRRQEGPCPECGGVGYKGQTAIFELLVLDDNVRKVLAATPKLDLLRQAAHKAGMKSLQEEGILLVARGVTSLPELMRVMKQ